MVQMSGFRSVEGLSAVLDSMPTAVILADARGTIVLVNLPAEKLFGYESGELVGESVEVLVPDRFRAAHPDLRERFASDPEGRPMGVGRDLLGRCKDGREIPIEIGLNSIDTPDGRFVISAVVDISERKRLEERFRATVEWAPVAMLMVDPGGAIRLVNAELDRLFGYDRDELLGQQVEVLLPERFRAHHPGLRKVYFEHPEARPMGAGRDLFGLRKDGSEFRVEIGLNPVRMGDGFVVLGAIEDISEREQTRALERAVEELERSNIELQRFAYVASHDLQTPMRSVTSFLGLLESTYSDRLDAQGRDWIRRVVESMRHLRMLVRDMLDYSRVDSRSRRFEPVSLSAVVDDALGLLEAELRETGAEIRREELPTVMGDRSQLVQLLLNLLGNSLKYRSAEEPRIHLSARREGTEWIVSVGDNGIGIASRHQARIFEMFERLHDQREYPGTGIGLAVCRRVVSHHGGRIWVESGLGAGSTFRFTLPATTESPS